MFKKLRKKFILVAMCSVLVVLALIIGIINVVNYINVAASADEIVALLIEGKGEFGKGDKPSPETPYETRYFTVIISSEGAVDYVNTDRIAAVDDARAADYALELYLSGKTSGFLGVYRFGTVAVEDGGIMYILVDCSKELSGFYSFLWASIGVGAAGLAMVFILVFLLSGRAMKPVAESYSKQKRFITDASHEIKTPLTIISAEAEILEMQGGANEWTEGIKSQVKRLTSLTEKLVFLARMDEENTVQSVDFSISDAAEECVAPFSSVAIARGLTLDADIQKNITFRGDESMIRRLITQLMDNAMKYADENGKVSFSLSRSGGKVRITVKNTASSLDEGDMSVFFERFYRGDKSRNSLKGGHGIGLSVVKAIVSAHKGKISARCEKGEAIFDIFI